MHRFFIIGNPRSGTTLFRLMLHKHSKMSVPPEAGFLVWLYDKFNSSDFSNGYIDILNALKETKKIEAWNLEYTLLEEYLLKEKPKKFFAVMDKIYEFYSFFTLKKEVSIFGDKNNYYLQHIKLLSKLYTKAKFIHIVRDGRSVAASYKGVMKKNINSKYAPILPTNMDVIATEWCSNLDTIEDGFMCLDNTRTYTIRYEDLILNPKEVLTNVCEFLSVPFEEKMLEYYKINEEEGLEPKEYIAWKSKNLQPLRTNEVEQYKTLETDELKLFESCALKKLKKYKYL